MNSFDVCCECGVSATIVIKVGVSEFVLWNGGKNMVFYDASIVGCASVVLVRGCLERSKFGFYLKMRMVSKREKVVNSVIKIRECEISVERILKTKISF